MEVDATLRELAIIAANPELERHGRRVGFLQLDVDAEVAQILKIPKKAVYRLVSRNELPACRVGRLLRITVNDLKAFLAGHATTIRLESEQRGMSRG